MWMSKFHQNGGIIQQIVVSVTLAVKFLRVFDRYKIVYLCDHQCSWCCWLAANYVLLLEV